MTLGAPVLIIDDDPALVEAVQDMLESAGHSTAAASNGFQALRLVREVKPAAIVCDLVMPEMTGSDVLRTLASDPTTARIPRVLMTGRSDVDRSCAHGFLLKPFQADDILKMLERITRVPYAVNTNETDARWQG